jgi:cytochrome c
MNLYSLQYTSTSLRSQVRRALNTLSESFPMPKLSTLVLLALALPAPALHAAGDVAAGKAAFARCAACHQLGPSARGAFGPQLNGIIGRPAAASTDYRYSAAMKSARIVWSEKNLAAFIQAPGDVVPGNKMRFFGIGNEQTIADLLAYLRTFP